MSKNRRFLPPSSSSVTRVTAFFFWGVLITTTTILPRGAFQADAQFMGTADDNAIPINNLPLNTAKEVQYIEGYFEGEGYIDLSKLEFRIEPGNATSSSSMIPTTSLDVAVVHVPEEVCNEPPANPHPTTVAVACPITKWMDTIGIGARSGDNGGWWWCCNSAVPSTVCNTNDTPHLIVNENVMDGAVRHLELKPGNSTITPPQDAQFIAAKGGYFIILMANCDAQNGQPITVDGDVVFVSLEQEIESIVNEDTVFYGMGSVAYLCLFFWFASLMHQHKESRIRLEEWIFGTISVGFAEVLLRSIEFLVWRQTNQRNPVLGFMASAAYGAKHGIVRGMLVLICSGVGVTRTSLENPGMVALVLLTLLYIFFSTTLSFLGFLEERKSSDIVGRTYDKDDKMAQWMWECIVFTWIIDLVFLFWIPMSLYQTIVLLRRTNQERKLERFRWLNRILMSAIGLSLLLFLAVTVDLIIDQGRMASHVDLAQVNEINVYLILLLVAFVWRPNPMAREYAYVTEAATEENELELTESTAGVPASPDAAYNSFPIDSAEAT